MHVALHHIAMHGTSTPRELETALGQIAPWGRIVDTLNGAGLLAAESVNGHDYRYRLTAAGKLAAEIADQSISSAQGRLLALARDYAAERIVLDLVAKKMVTATTADAHAAALLHYTEVHGRVLAMESLLGSAAMEAFGG